MNAVKLIVLALVLGALFYLPNVGSAAGARPACGHPGEPLCRAYQPCGVRPTPLRPHPRLCRAVPLKRKHP